MIEEVEKEEYAVNDLYVHSSKFKIDPYRIKLLKEWVKSGSNTEKSPRYK
ncbi:MAG: hypothetical protein MZV64_68455 [Ignavibacteriales bacterium]|nr:hypothetical protein [Ignavibacteriales bacterium]